MKAWIFSLFLLATSSHLWAEPNLIKITNRFIFASELKSDTKTTLRFATSSQTSNIKIKKSFVQLEVDAKDLTLLEQTFPQASWKKSTLELTAYGHWEKMDELFFASELQLKNNAGKRLWLSAPKQTTFGKTNDSMLKKHNPNLDFILL